MVLIINILEIKDNIITNKNPLNIIQQKIYDQCFSLSKYIINYFNRYINYLNDNLVNDYINILKKSTSQFIHKYLSVDSNKHLIIDPNSDKSICNSFKMYLSLILLNITHLIVKINSKNDIVDTGKRKVF